jgi:phosphoadenosine phosphosulfate reductase
MTEPKPYQSRLLGSESDLEKVSRMDLDDRVARAIALLRDNEPDDGYYLAFSGGKDSCACKELARMAKVSFEAWYSNTTIDPPELVRFIKLQHPDVKWNNPKYGNMMHRVATRVGLPPTRVVRWCCEEYKEHGGAGRTKIFGVRALESRARLTRWKEISLDTNGDTAICPIVYWSDEQVWEFIKFYSLPYCSLYDEGFRRLGCVGCPLLNPESQRREFERWPNFERNWKRAIISNWENYKDKTRKDGKPYMHAKFATGEDFWKLWLHEKTPDTIRGDCQPMLLWTNEPGGDVV